MINTNFTTIQDVRRNYKKVVSQVEETNKPTVVISNNQPQFAIVSIDMLKTIPSDSGNSINTAKALLALGQWAEKNHIKGPADLSTDHNKYIYDEEI